MTTTSAPATELGRPQVTAAPAAGRARPGPVPLARRVLLVLHLATGLGWMGVTSTFVVLTLWLLGGREPATVRAGYAVHEVLVVWLARPAAIGAAATGLLLAATAGRYARPRWWLWWAPAKLVLIAIYHVLMISAVAVPAVFRPGGRFRRPRRTGRTS